MKVTGIIWLRNVVDKLQWKHNVTTDEVEEVFNRSPRYRFIETGDVEGEDLYAALGQTESGRYLVVYFVHKATGEALIVSAREMTKKERRTYGKK
ncbi:MAG: BrnT family toxin [Chloroflexi bacterium]|nr:BrnT family toxin [Chloroflexota bacterium]